MGHILSFIFTWKKLICLIHVCLAHFITYDPLFVLVIYLFPVHFAVQDTLRLPLMLTVP